MFRPSKDAEILLDLTKKTGNFGSEFFVGYIIIGVGLGLLCPLHLALSPNCKGELPASLKNIRQKSASLELLIGFCLDFFKSTDH